MRLDCLVEMDDPLVEPIEMQVGVGAHLRIGAFAGPGALAGPNGDELVTAFDEGGQAFAVSIRRIVGRGLESGRDGCEHSGVDRIGLGQEAGGAGEVAGPPRVDTGMHDAGRSQRRPQRPVILAGGLEEGTKAPVHPPTRSRRAAAVVDLDEETRAGTKPTHGLKRPGTQRPPARTRHDRNPTHRNPFTRRNGLTMDPG